MARDKVNLKNWRANNYAANRDEIISRRKARYMRDPRNQMLTSARQRAKKTNVPFDLSPDDFCIPEICPVFGHAFEFGTRESHDWAPTLDKIIPELGYVKGNIQVISHRANMLKGNATVQELWLLADYMMKNNNQV
jgi:hypothetical protein